MGIFEQFPYTNFHDLNLDWILRAIKSMDKKLDEFVASNVLSYADPIQWDIETQYAKNTVVVDPKTGTAYMSINPVPVGQLLTNKYYWQPIFNYDEIVNTLKKQIAAVQADQHDIIHVSVGRGDLVWVANKLYRLTKSLDAGSKITENENAVPVTVEDAIINIDTTKNITRNTDGTITDTAGTITRNSDNIIDTANDAISVSGKTITNVAADSITNSSTNITETASAGIARNAATITDTATGDVTVSGENITDTATGDVTVSGENITDTASAGIARNAVTITDTASGDISVNGKNITDTASAGITRNAATITDTATGDITVNGRNIVNAAPNNITFNVDGILDFNTKNPIKYSTPQALNHYFRYIPATDRTGNEYKILVDNGAMFGTDFFSGIVIGCGDSIAWGHPYTMNDGTLNKIAEKTGKTLNTDFYNVSVSAEGFTNIDSRKNFKERLQQLETVINDKNNVTGIIVIGGTNDFSYGATPESFNMAVIDFITYAHATYPYAKIAIVSDFMSSTDKNDILNMARYLHALQLINYPACHVANLGVALKKWYLYSHDTQADDIHPNKTGYDMAASFIISKIIGGETLDYTYANVNTFTNMDSCYEFNGDYFRYILYGGHLFTKSNGFTNNGGNNPSNMGYINNIKLKIRTLAAGADEGQPWVKSSPQYGFVNFVSSDNNWNGIFAPSLIKFMLGTNGRLYVDVAGIDTKAKAGFISSNEINEMYCNPFLDGNLNHVTLLTT